MTGLDRANPADILDAGYSAKPVEAIIEALEDVHDMDVTMRDYAVSVFHRVVKPLMWEREEARAALRMAVDAYGKPGGPWNVPSDPGGWLHAARTALKNKDATP
jgi:hypothetical protein